MMAGHISSESLSAYLDGEVAPEAARRLAAHLAACDPCRCRLEAVQRLVGGLGRLPAAPLPEDLAARVRGRIAAEAGAPARARAPAEAGVRRRLRSLVSWLWWRDLPSLRGRFGSLGALSPAAVAALALIGAVLLLENGAGIGAGPRPGSLASDPARARPAFLVSEAFGEAPAVLPQTTSEVAGRVFVWSDDVWVQRGIDASEARQPRAVPAHSAAGRALLAKHSDLGVLLADGSRVVLRYNFETLELWNGS
jgi:anti-sigma factor RsiW